MILNLSAKSLENTSKSICILERCPWKDFWNIPVKKILFSVYHTPGYVCDCLQCTTLKLFDISFSKPPSRNSMIIHLVYNEDKMIYFLIFIYLFIYILISLYREREIEISTNILSNFPLQVKLGHWFYISQKCFWKLKKTWKLCKYFCPLYKNPGPFRKFSTRMWQNACANTVRRAMVCDVYFPFSKFL